MSNSSKAWRRLLATLTSDELLLLHRDWGLSFHGTPTSDELTESLISNLAGASPDDDQERVCRIALRAVARLSSRQSWRSLALRHPAAEDVAADEGREMQRRARESLGDVFEEGTFHAGAMADPGRPGVVWIRIATRESTKDQNWIASLACVRAQVPRLLVAGITSQQHGQVIIECVAAALGCSRRVTDTGTFGADVDALLDHRQIAASEAEFPDDGDERPEAEADAEDGGDDRQPPKKRRAKAAPKKKEKEKREKHRESEKPRHTWWRKHVPRKTKELRVRCTARGEESWGIVRVVVRGSNIRDGLKQLETMGVLVDVSPQTRTSLVLGKK